MQMAIETVNIKILKKETLINFKYRYGPMDGRDQYFDFETNLLDSL